MLKGFYQKIVNFGLSDGLTHNQRKHVKLNNQALFYSAVLTSTFIPIFLLFGSVAGFVVQSIAVALYWCGFIFNYRQQFLLCNCFLLTVGIVHITVISFVMGEQAGMHYYYSPCLLSVMLYFLPHQRRYMLTILVIGMGMASLLMLSFFYVETPYPMGEYYAKICRRITLITSTASTILFGLYFHRANSQAETNLSSEVARHGRLLTNLLPEQVRHRLQIGEHVAEQHPDATVILVDLGHPPKRISLAKVTADEIRYQATKAIQEMAETAGMRRLRTLDDAWMLVAYLPEASGQSITRVIELAENISRYCKRQELGGGRAFTHSIAVHHGPLQISRSRDSEPMVVELWGSTLQILSRLPVIAPDSEICVSEDVFLQIQQSYSCDFLGLLELPDRGRLRAYSLGAKTKI